LLDETNSYLELMKPTTIRSVIAASSVGTMIEWYDFYIFGMLAKTISTQFFPEGNPTAALLSTSTQYSVIDSCKFGFTMMVITLIMIIIWGMTMLRFLNYTPNGVFF